MVKNITCSISYLKFILILFLLFYILLRKLRSVKTFFFVIKQGFIVKNECLYFIQPPTLQKINYCIGQRKLDLPRVAKNLRPALPRPNEFPIGST